MEEDGGKAAPRAPILCPQLSCRSLRELKDFPCLSPKSEWEFCPVRFPKPLIIPEIPSMGLSASPGTDRADQPELGFFMEFSCILALKGCSWPCHS